MRRATRVSGRVTALGSVLLLFGGATPAVFGSTLSQDTPFIPRPLPPGHWPLSRTGYYLIILRAPVPAMAFVRLWHVLDASNIHFWGSPDDGKDGKFTFQYSGTPGLAVLRKRLQADPDFLSIQRIQPYENHPTPAYNLHLYQAPAPLGHPLGELGPPAGACGRIRNHGRPYQSGLHRVVISCHHPHP